MVYLPIAHLHNTSLYYETHGSGTPIVLVHPPLLTSANFRYQQEQLSQFYKVLTFDIRGHGQSPPSKAPITYDLIVDDIIGLLDHLGIKQAYIAGYSTGGSIALHAMLQSPARWHGGILISAMSEASDPRLRNRIRAAIHLSRYEIASSLLRLSVTWGNANNLSTFLHLQRQARSGHRANIQQYYACSLNYNCTASLPQIQLPALLLYGQQDYAFAKYRHLLKEGIEHSTLVVLDNVKHQLPTKAADRMTSYIHEWIELVHPLAPYMT
ncbi:alpha/beta fold hydrolase [Paenibacillus aquistagni]|uniref:alpha/beta fold hydrolase n=1 Tax=Paenibacillus aquistagni TaxID=1852522 RepID=UPI003CC83108